MSTFTNARYANQHGSSILCERDGVRMSVPADPANVDFSDLVSSGAQIAPFTRPTTADDVRAEASRRMQVLLGARDAAHLDQLIANGSREALRLLHVRVERAWTEAEAARVGQLATLDAALEAIRAASNAMEAAPPSDYTSDARWP